MQLSLIRNALGESGRFQLDEACDCWKVLSALYLTQEVPQHLAEVGQRWECRVTSSLPCPRVADSNAVRKAGGQCSPGGCSGLKEPELGWGVFGEAG